MYAPVGIVPERHAIEDYARKRKSEGADVRTIIDELVSGKGPCSSVTGAVKCEVSDVSTIVMAASPRPKRGKSVLLYGAMALAAVVGVSMLRRRR